MKSKMNPSMNRLFLISTVLLVISTAGFAQSADFPTLTGSYLDQKQPGSTPEKFAPGIVSTGEHEFSCCFSPDGREFYFARRDGKTMQTTVMVSRLLNGSWTSPEPFDPLLPEGFTFEPYITPDNQRLYFQTAGMIDGKPEMMTKYIERAEEGWSEVKTPGEPFNPGKTMHISATMEGTIYTTDISGGMGSESLGMMKKVKGNYENLEKLGAPFNQTAKQQHPWVAPDESYLVLTVRRPGQTPSSLLFVSFKTKDGRWSEPEEIKLGMDAGQPFITYDGKFLFFTTGDPRVGSDIFWVSATIIDELRNTDKLME